MQSTINLNPIPYLTWTWLKINKDTVTYDFALTENNGTDVQLPPNVSVRNGKAVVTELPEPESSIGTEATQLITSSFAAKVYTFEKSKEETKPLIIRIKADVNAATNNIIHAKAGAEAKVIIVYGANVRKKNCRNKLFFAFLPHLI